MEITETIQAIKDNKDFVFPVEFKPELLDYFRKRIDAEIADLQVFHFDTET